MALDETFRPYSKYDELEVFQLIGRAQEVREVRPSDFDGPVAEWADRRMRNIGETIVPRQVYIVPLAQEDHRVAWIYHDGIDIDTEETFCLHHIACDCSAEVDSAPTEEEKQAIIANCSALTNVLAKRAHFINATYGMDNIFNSIYDREKPAYEQSSSTQHFAIRSIMYVLEHDYRHPESWMGNVESGWNLIGLLSNIMQLRREDVQWYTELLASQELVETDGVVVELAPKIKQAIDAEKTLREVSAQIEREMAA